MTGNSERQLESESKGIIQESFRFSQAEQLYGNMSFFTDTVLFEYSYPEKRLYLSANAKAISIYRHLSVFSRSTEIMHPMRGRCGPSNSVWEKKGSHFTGAAVI